MSSLLFIDKVAPAVQAGFAERVRQIARKYRMNPNWLMGVMNSETGGSFDPAQKNMAGSGATGLIQFMPETARDLGTTTTALSQMDEVEQLDWVDRYIERQMRNFRIDRIKDYDDLYLLVFYPAYVGKPNETEFPSYIYRQNAGVDDNKDGRITVADFKAFIRRKIPKGYVTEFTSRYRWLSGRYLAFGVVALLLIVGTILLLRRYY